MTLCLSLSVTSRCSIEVVGRIDLVFGTESSFDQSYTVLLLRKFRYLQTTVQYIIIIDIFRVA